MLHKKTYILAHLVLYAAWIRQFNAFSPKQQLETSDVNLNPKLLPDKRLLPSVGRGPRVGRRLFAWYHHLVSTLDSISPSLARFRDKNAAIIQSTLAWLLSKHDVLLSEIIQQINRVHQAPDHPGTARP